MHVRIFSSLLIILISLLATGCAAVALTAAGIGGGVAASHQMGGLAYRTFTAPIPKVRTAVLAALKKMDIKPNRTETIELGERVVAFAGDRTIEVELESLTSNATRIRVVVKREGGMVVDAATAVEIINQTEVAFGRG